MEIGGYRRGRVVVRRNNHFPLHPPEPTELTAEQLDAGIARLSRRLIELRSFDPSSVTAQFNIPEMSRLRAAIDDALVRTFGAATPDYERYCGAAELDNGPFNYAYEVPITSVRASLKRSQENNVALLEQAIESLRERRAEPQPTAGVDVHNPEPARSRRVFIVHGHDEGAREMLATFLRKADFDPVILHERPNEGRTIIEKVVAHGDVGFAVVLLTPDDVGSVKGGASKPRARQNVLLELGYFVGRLGRPNVCALKRGDLEIPSDWQGVVHTELDDHGGWRTALAKELEAAGHEIDWRKALS